MNDKFKTRAILLLLGLGIPLLLGSALGLLDPNNANVLLWVGVGFIVGAVILLLGGKFERVSGTFKEYFRFEMTFRDSVPARELDPRIEQQRRDYAARRRSELPGHDAPAFHLLEEKMAITATPFRSDDPHVYAGQQFPHHRLEQRVQPVL